MFSDDKIALALRIFLPAIQFPYRPHPSRVRGPLQDVLLETFLGEALLALGWDFAQPVRVAAVVSAPADPGHGLLAAKLHPGIQRAGEINVQLAASKGEGALFTSILGLGY